jgi:predicted enzyme related to lactoylglutathione lyase
MGDPVVYFEIGGADRDAVLRFYSELFGWALEDLAPGGYTLIDTRAGLGIIGGIGRSTDGTSWATFYAEVPDVQQTLNRAESLGGKTVVPMTQIPNMLTWGMFNDPNGALVGLIQRAPLFERKPSPGDAPGVDWFEVLGPGADRTCAFYADLFGWQLDGSGPYRFVDTQSDQRGISGGIGSGGGTAIWATFYAKVPNVEAMLARAEQLGAKCEYGPNQVDDHMRTGAFRDPAGNLIGVYEHPDHN